MEKEQDQAVLAGDAVKVIDLVLERLQGRPVEGQADLVKLMTDMRDDLVNDQAGVWAHLHASNPASAMKGTVVGDFMLDVIYSANEVSQGRAKMADVQAVLENLDNEMLNHAPVFTKTLGNVEGFAKYRRPEIQLSECEVRLNGLEF